MCSYDIVYRYKKVDLNRNISIICILLPLFLLFIYIDLVIDIYLSIIQRDDLVDLQSL